MVIVVISVRFKRILSILEQYKNRDGDFKSLDKILSSINDPITEYDSQILNKLKDDTRC